MSITPVTTQASIAQTIPTADLPFVDPTSGRLTLWAYNFLTRLGGGGGVSAANMETVVTALNTTISNVNTIDVGLNATIAEVDAIAASLPGNFGFLSPVNVLATGDAIANLGFAPYNSTNPDNYINGHVLFTNISQPVRGSGVVYTNSTGGPLLVCISFAINNASGSYYAAFYVNGIQVAYWTPQIFTTGYPFYGSVTWILGAGATYEFVINGTIENWTEAY